jgi:capsid protein
MGAIDLFGKGPLFPRAPRAQESGPPVVAWTQLEPYRHSYHDGSKFPGGFGPTEILVPDYWTLRQRSAQLFETNLYARGLIRRLVTNEIHNGLHLEATPEEAILGKPEDTLAAWSETVENRFALWAKDSYLCDSGERLTFGAMQQLARQEALVVGDVLCVLQQDQRTRAPRVRLVNGAKVQSPLRSPATKGNRIVHGVELDPQGRHAAYWVTQADGTSKRLPAVGEKSGRRIAWLLYGTDRRIDDVRGKPLLGLVLQSLREIDRYRDATQRKANVLATIAGFITRDQDKAPGLGISGGAMRRGTATTLDSPGQERSFKFQEHLPGIFIEQLQHGEEPKAFQVSGTTDQFSDFEEAIIHGIAWANEVPPEILKLGFSSNYSASQAAINEFKTYLNKTRTTFGENFCEPVYQEWLLGEVLAQRIEAQGLLEAWRDPAQWDQVGAWMSSDWSGNIKPAVDLSKLVKGYKELLEIGAISYDRASRELTGTKFSKNVQKQRREVLELVEALKPLAELEAAKKAAKPVAPAPSDGPPTGAPNEAEEDENDDADSEPEERLPN